MITAVGSSVLLDALTNRPIREPASVWALGPARSLGRLAICPTVWAEVGAHACARPQNGVAAVCLTTACTGRAGGLFWSIQVGSGSEATSR